MVPTLQALCNATKNHALILHASGVIRHGRASLFLAASGGGKSTVASLSDAGGDSVLCDDTALILDKGSAFHLRPLPRQATAMPVLAPLGEHTELRTILFLEKAQLPGAQPITPLEATARCLREHAIFEFDNWSPRDRLTALDRLMRLFRTVPAYVLRFAKDNRFWEVIDEIDQREEAGLAPA